MCPVPVGLGLVGWFAVWQVRQIQFTAICKLQACFPDRWSFHWPWALGSPAGADQYSDGYLGSVLGFYLPWFPSILSSNSSTQDIHWAPPGAPQVRNRQSLGSAGFVPSPSRHCLCLSLEQCCELTGSCFVCVHVGCSSIGIVFGLFGSVFYEANVPTQKL